MRIIKFKGKDIKNNEWVYGDLIHRNIYCNNILIIRTYDNGNDHYEDFEVIPESVELVEESE